ncbi:MAG: metallopeptidase TldD-related protein [Gammaproteobacteria bacterium]
MDTLFGELASQAFSLLSGDEVLLLSFEGEDSEFVRFNHNAVRQAGHVRQQRLQLTLIEGQRQAHADLELSGRKEQDLAGLRTRLSGLRELLPFLPEDPYLHYATEVQETFERSAHSLPAATGAVQNVIDAAHGLDLVGLWSSGEMASGFANSLGQLNWHSTQSFHLDWSLYDHGDKAVKQAFAGLEWRPEQLEERMRGARDNLALLARPARSISPGQFRVFLSPAALYELMTLLGWGGFGLKSHRTAQTPLLQMVCEGARLDPRISLSEHHAGGLTPRFTRAGFIKPDRVELIRSGVYGDCLASPRSAREYAAPVNCDVEHPQSLELAPGDLPFDAVTAALETGLLISNLWYCNYSDRSRCRITGMTRFACLWVQNGRPLAPVNAMRFDDTLYNVLGHGLVALTRERERIFDASTYAGRSRESARLPGALVDGFTFTL